MKKKPGDEKGTDVLNLSGREEIANGRCGMGGLLRSVKESNFECRIGEY